MRCSPTGTACDKDECLGKAPKDDYATIRKHYLASQWPIHIHSAKNGIQTFIQIASVLKQSLHWLLSVPSIYELEKSSPVQMLVRRMESQRSLDK